MGKRKRGVGHAQRGRDLRRVAVELEPRTAAGFAGDFDLQPIHAIADACAQSLGGCFLGCEAGGEASRGTGE